MIDGPATRDMPAPAGPMTPAPRSSRHVVVAGGARAGAARPLAVTSSAADTIAAVEHATAERYMGLAGVATPMVQGLSVGGAIPRNEGALLPATAELSSMVHTSGGAAAHLGARVPGTPVVAVPVAACATPHSTPQQPPAAVPAAARREQPSTGPPSASESSSAANAYPPERERPPDRPTGAIPKATNAVSSGEANAASMPVHVPGVLVHY